MDLVGDALVGKVWADTHGLSSGAGMSASKTFVGGEVGIEGLWSPWSELPLVLEAGIAAGRLTPRHAGVIVDGYTPLERGISATRLRLGAAWRPASR